MASYVAPLTLSFWLRDDNLATMAVLSRRRRVSIRHPPDAGLAGTANRIHRAERRLTEIAALAPSLPFLCSRILGPQGKPTTLLQHPGNASFGMQTETAAI
jgi:hypothetical protein